MTKVALVTGGSSGIGLAVVQKLLAEGYRVWELSRRPFELEGVIHRSVDVTQEAAVQAAVRELWETEQQLDVVIGCAGMGIAGAVEFTEDADAKRQMDVNFFGSVHLAQAVLPYLREQKRGKILLTSSVAAPAAIPFQTYYSASKAALNSFALSLRNEVRPYGIKVAVVQPGDTSTGFTDARKTTLAGDEAYGGRISRSISKMEQDERKGASPEKVAALFWKLIQKRSPAPVYSVGLDYKFLSLLLKLLPGRLVSYLLYLLYAK